MSKEINKQAEEINKQERTPMPTMQQILDTPGLLTFLVFIVLPIVFSIGGGIEWFIPTIVFVFILTVVGFVFTGFEHVYNAMDQVVINLSTPSSDLSSQLQRASPEDRQYLQTLDCHGTGLTSLELLQACPGLQTLNCGENQLTSLEPLRVCPGLQTLECHGNRLTSLEPLRACLGLQILNCNGNQLTNLKPLQACPGLQSLGCSDNRLTSLEPLQACPGLQGLGCSDNRLTSLEPLRVLTSLQYLSCHTNQLTSLEPLHGLKSLKKLDCRKNPSLSQQEIERFQEAVPSCEVSSTWIGWKNLDRWLTNLEATN